VWVELGQLTDQIVRDRARISRALMMNAQAQWKLLHTWIISALVKQHLVQSGRIDGPTENLSQILDIMRSTSAWTSGETSSLFSRPWICAGSRRNPAQQWYESLGSKKTVWSSSEGWRSYMKRGWNQNLSGNEAYCTACSALVILKNSCVNFIAKKVLV